MRQHSVCSEGHYAHVMVSCHVRHLRGCVVAIWHERAEVLLGSINIFYMNLFLMKCNTCELTRPHILVKSAQIQKTHIVTDSQCLHATMRLLAFCQHSALAVLACAVCISGIVCVVEGQLSPQSEPPGKANLHNMQTCSADTQCMQLL